MNYFVGFRINTYNFVRVVNIYFYQKEYVGQKII